MDFLKAEIERKKRQLQEKKVVGPDKKYFKRGELLEIEKEEYLKKHLPKLDDVKKLEEIKKAKEESKDKRECLKLPSYRLVLLTFCPFFDCSLGEKGGTCRSAYFATSRGRSEAQRAARTNPAVRRNRSSGMRSTSFHRN